MKSRCWIQLRESSAALALENRIGIDPAGAVDATGAAGTGASGSIVGVDRRCQDRSGRTCELAAPDSNKSTRAGRTKTQHFPAIQRIIPSLCIQALYRSKG